MEQITKYFNTEKNESILFVLVGFFAIIIATYFFIKVKQPFYIGMSYPLIVVALIQIFVGSSAYFRSPKDILRVSQIVKNDKLKIKSEEIPRMKVVMKNFTIYKWVEIALILLGIIMFLYTQPMAIYKGIGIGLFIQASFMLILDLFAESRGEKYLEYLELLI